MGFQGSPEILANEDLLVLRVVLVVLVDAVPRVSLDQMELAFLAQKEIVESQETKAFLVLLDSLVESVRRVNVVLLVNKVTG